jgi:hypothetical protein
MISQIINIEGLQLSFSIKDSDVQQISTILALNEEERLLKIVEICCTSLSLIENDSCNPSMLIIWDGVALDKHMMHVTISYPLPDNRLLTQLFTALEEGSMLIIWDIISTFTEPSSNAVNNCVKRRLSGRG